VAERAEMGQAKALGAANFVVADGGGSSAGAGGAGFSLSRDDMTAELGNLRKLADRITLQLEASQPMWSIQSPGKDPASLRNTDASNKSGLAYRDFLTRQSRFVAVIIDKMEKALGMHTANDQQAAQTVNAQNDGGRF
jgi:hypothetical protein